MAVTHGTASARPTLGHRSVFLSASIPDPARWDGPFEPIEITDAVVAAAREVFAAGGRLVTAADPTIAPLILYVAAELTTAEDEPPVTVYQSDLFVDVLPEATRRFEEDGVGIVHWTPAHEGDRPEPGEWDASLAVMRQTMLSSADPAAAIFIGGMAGIDDEYRLFGDMYPKRPRYPIGRPGGEASRLSRESASRVQGLDDADVYPALFRRVVADIIDQLPG